MWTLPSFSKCVLALFESFFLLKVRWHLFSQNFWIFFLNPLVFYLKKWLCRDHENKKNKNFLANRKFQYLNKVMGYTEIIGGDAELLEDLRPAASREDPDNWATKKECDSKKNMPHLSLLIRRLKNKSRCFGFIQTHAQTHSALFHTFSSTTPFLRIFGVGRW